VSRPAGRWLAVTAGAAAVAVLAVLLTAPPAVADERGPVLFQPVKLVDGKFVGTGESGPFTTQFKDGVKFGSADVERSKVVDKHFEEAHEWGSGGNKGGMIVDNDSGRKICQFTITSTGNGTATFPKDPKVYAMPAGWAAKVSDDGKTLTITAVKQPDDCVPVDGYFWMKVPASPMPDDKGSATLEGKLSLLEPVLEPDPSAVVPT